MSNVVDLQNPTQKTATSSWGTTNAAAPTFPKSTGVAAPTPGSISVTNDGAARNRFRNSTTRIQVMFTDKLSKLSGKNKTITVTSGHVAQQIFKPERGVKAPHDIHYNAEDSNSNVDLSKGIITRIAVVSSHNEYPYPLTFDLTSQGESSNCFSLDGKQFPICLYPGESNRGTEYEIYNAGDAADDPLLKRYGHISLNSMWENIQTFKSHNFVFVPLDHDVVRLVKLNPEKFGPAPTKADIREDMYYKMDGHVVCRAIDELYFNIINKFKFTDLSKFKVTMARLDGKDLDDLSGSKWDHYDSVEQQFKKAEVLHAGFELKVTWTYPQQDNVPSTTTTTSSASIAPPVLANNTTTNVPNATQQYGGVMNSPTYQAYSASRLPVGAPVKLGQ